jgi:hypothetical protein
MLSKTGSYEVRNVHLPVECNSALAHVSFVDYACCKMEHMNKLKNEGLR